MKKTIRKGGFFASMGSPKSWLERAAAIKAKAQKGGKPEPSALLKIDDANGETMEFPEIGDVSEIVEGVAVTAADGEHVFEADGKIYTVTVLGGAVTTVAVEDATDSTEEFITAVVEELAANEEFKTTALQAIEDLKTELATAKTDFEKLKATLKHKGDGLEPDAPKATSVRVGGKTIDLSKINLKK